MANEINISVTVNFEFLMNATKKILVLQGGSRSSKTFSICQFLVHKCLTESNHLITVARDTLVVNKRTVFEDFLQILKTCKVKYRLNRSEMTIRINSNLIRFIGLDNIEKIHGLKHTICYVNEGLNTSLGTYNQILQRTSERLIIDFNPSVTEHFIYDWIDTRDDIEFKQTSILDNPLAPIEARKQILSYEPTQKNIEKGTANEFYWEVYGLGNRHKSDEVIFKSFDRHRHDAKKAENDWIHYGGDFGWTDPATLVEVVKNGNTLYLRVMLYESNLNNKDIAERIKENENIDLDEYQIWDSAEPGSINELASHSLNAIPAKKGQSSIYYGMQKLLGYNISVYDDELSENLAQEMRTARWKTTASGDIYKNGRGQPVAVGGNGWHCIDPARYVLLTFDL